MDLTFRVLPGPGGYMFSIKTIPKDLPPIPSGPVPCKECQAICRVIPTQHRDGRVEPTDIYCLNSACRLFKKDQRLIGSPHDEVTFNNDGTFTHSAEGPPDQNEANVERVTSVFLTAANRDFAMGLARSRDPESEGGVDAEMLDAAEKVVLRLQVTRAPMNSFWKNQRSKGHATRTLTATVAADLIREAIENKRLKASSDVDLVIDGTHASYLAMFSEQLVVKQDSAWLSQQGWRAIWVVGTSWLKCISGDPIPPALTPPS